MSDEIKVNIESLKKIVYGVDEIVKPLKDIVNKTLIEEEKKESINGNEMSRRFNDAFTHTEKKESELDKWIERQHRKFGSLVPMDVEYRNKLKQEVIVLVKKTVNETLAGDSLCFHIHPYKNFSTLIDKIKRQFEKM